MTDPTPYGKDLPPTLEANAHRLDAMQRLIDERYHRITELLAEKITGIRALLQEREDRYTERRLSANDRVDTAIRTLDAKMDAAFVSIEKSMATADAALRDYKTTSNEFRGTLADQARDLMPRKEVETLTNQIRERQDLQVQEMRSVQDALRKEISDLREYRSGVTGRETQTKNMRDVIGLLVGLVGLIVAILIALWTRGSHP